MTLAHVSIVLVTLINFIILVYYCWQTYYQRIKPALAMWIFFTIAVALCLTTYLSSGEFSIWDNIVNTTDLVLVSTVTIVIFFFGDRSSRFTRFDTGCLIAVLTILGFWLITQNHMLTNVLVQIIQIIAYFPVVKRLWQSGKNSESFIAWIGMLLAPAISLLSSKGILATIYSVRAVVCISILLILMLKIEVTEQLVKKQLLNNPAKLP